jgi:asparagine synthase (glutamine-hydrolysing)
MCGIAGMVRFDGPIARERLAAMVESISHRGPDDSGLFTEGGVGLGMRRLSILDLSPLGHQPMANEDERVQLVFNGEIYNFRDLRCRLAAQGHAFRSASDTEVLVHGYEQLGAFELARRLEGMFAFALLDRARRRLFLARDPFGIKPLYLRRQPGQLSFASEIRALSLDGGGRPAVASDFVQSYLRLGYVPTPRTAFSGVEKLHPGTILEVDLASGAERLHRYYELRPAPSEDLRDGELLERLGEALSLAVRRQLVADVPVGVFLSGGLDSSALSALAARFTAGRLRTFTMGFERSDRGDETGAAAMVARRIGSHNTAIPIAPKALADLGPVVAALEEPLADSAVLPLWHLCRGTSAHVKVALSGEGGDESLGGYARYFWGAVAGHLQGAPPALLAALGAAASALPSRSRGPLNVARRAGKLADSALLPEARRYLSWFDVFTPEEREALHPSREDLAAQRVEALFARAAALRLDAVQRLQLVDFSTFLLDNLLLKSDKLSMAHSLEVRVPMLDRPLAELGLGLPARAKVSPRAGKVLLRRLLSGRGRVPALLPRAIARRPKRGFEIPVDRWLRDEATRELRERLSRGPLVHQLGFSSAAIAAILERHARGQDLGRKVFSLLVLQTWAERQAASRCASST